MAEEIESLGERYFSYVESFLGFLTDPNDRFFIVYLFSSFVIAFILFRKSKSEDGLFRFIFPKSVWSNPSAWLDVRYFFFHGMIGHFLVHLFTASLFVFTLSLTLNMETLEGLADIETISTVHRWTMAILALIVITIVNDFSAFYLHYLQHKIPVLWQFHKVHHSGEVMHPLSNFREHPIDNLAYAIVSQIVFGVTWGIMLTLIGFRPDAFEIFGIGIVMILFNLAGYQLRYGQKSSQVPLTTTSITVGIRTI